MKTCSVQYNGTVTPEIFLLLYFIFKTKENSWASLHLSLRRYDCSRDLLGERHSVISKVTRVLNLGS